MDLWRQLHHYFDTDDGSLPEISLAGLRPSDVEQMFALLRTIGDVDLSDERTPRVWDFEKQTDVRVDAVPNAAALVAANRALAFAVWMRRVKFEGHALPDLGVHVYPDTIRLFFRMGAGWNELAVQTLFRLLIRLVRIAPNMHFEFDCFGDPTTFLDVWAKFNAASASKPESL